MLILKEILFTYFQGLHNNFAFQVSFFDSGFSRRKSKLASLIKHEHQHNHLFSYLSNHLKSALISLDRLIRTPISSLLTIIIIAISLSLPLGMMILLQNAQKLSQNLNKGTQISLYLKMTLSEREVQALTQKLNSDENIASAKYISPNEGLLELQKNVNVQGILTQLKENPLPAVIVVTPKSTAVPVVESLVNTLQNLPEVDAVRLDRAWFQRLNCLVTLLGKCFWVVFSLLAIGVIFIVVNTIRLAFREHTKEIKVLKLIGANDAYVRRPFLYTGLYYGLAGAALAWVIIFIGMLQLRVPIYNLAISYGSQFNLSGLGSDGFLVLFGVGALLGWIGARLAVKF